MIRAPVAGTAAGSTDSKGRKITRSGFWALRGAPRASSKCIAGGCLGSRSGATIISVSDTPNTRFTSSASYALDACHTTPAYNRVNFAIFTKAHFFIRFRARAPSENWPLGATMVGLDGTLPNL